MALHLTEQIMQYVEITLTGLLITGNNVVRARVYSFDEEIKNGLTLMMGTDNPLEPEIQTFPFLDSRLVFYVDVHARTVIEQIDTQLNAIRKEVTIALMADYTMNDLVIDINEIGSDDPEFSGEGNDITGIQRMGFEVDYRRLRTDPSIGG